MLSTTKAKAIENEFEGDAMTLLNGILRAERKQLFLRELKKLHKPYVGNAQRDCF